jgi:hypothetical protein
MPVTKIPKRPFGPMPDKLLDIEMEIQSMDESLSAGLACGYPHLDAMPYDDMAAVSTAIKSIEENLKSIKDQIDKHLAARGLFLGNAPGS